MYKPEDKRTPPVSFNLHLIHIHQIVKRVSQAAHIFFCNDISYFYDCSFFIDTIGYHVKNKIGT